MMRNFKDTCRYQFGQRGFSLLEVLIGIAIFAIGMLALASLQGALTRSSAEAKVRTTAVNIAEQIIEGHKGFNLIADFTGIGTETIYFDSDMNRVAVGSAVYTANQVVEEYYYDLASDGGPTAFKTCPTCVTIPDFKTVLLTVSWGDNRDYVIDDENTAGNLGGGSVQVSGTISKGSVASALKVSEESDDDIIAPIISYEPGERPDIVALTVGDGKFKESLTPEPDVRSKDDLVKTTFEVITYSSSNGGQFLRREEFVTVPCECTFAGTGKANRPVIWAGDEYAGGHSVTKPYGISANKQQPAQLCETCCRDHHDGPSGQEGDNDDFYSNVVGPFKNDDEYVGTARASDHKHYNNANGPAVTSGNYLEVCRMVRVDGFLKVAQDFRREDQYVFPADFLDAVDPGDTEINTYSGYVTNAVLAYNDEVDLDDYPASPPCIGIPQPPLAGDPTCVAVPNMQNTYPAPRGSNELPSWTSLQTTILAEQQLRSRGVYIDYISNDLRKFIVSCISGGELVNDCCIRNGEVANECTSNDLYMDKTGSAEILEILPFFEVQMTKLENWNQDPPKITLTNQPIADANTHSRGKASQIVVGKGNNATISLGTTEVNADSHRGNIGFTNTLAIDPEFNDQLKHGILDLHSLDASGGGSTGVDPTRVVLSGQFSASTVTGDPTITVLGDGDATCSRTPGGYYCFYPANAVAPTLIVGGYEDTHTLDPANPDDCIQTRTAVSGSLTKLSSTATSATFSLLVSEGTTYDIEITGTCGTGGFGGPG